MLEEVKQRVWKANLDLVAQGLVTLTWGNASERAPGGKLFVIKPSGVSYGDMKSEQMVVVDLDGKVVEGELNPSSDTETHRVLYREFPEIGGIVHTHSPWATAFAQARMEIPCLGTTHADHFFGPVPVTRPLSREELDAGYELNTGRVIAERFRGRLSTAEMPAVLVAGHAPFTWGKDAAESVKNAVALEAVAKMAHATLMLRREPIPFLEEYVLEKHYQRKHGPGAYYGQKK